MNPITRFEEKVKLNIATLCFEWTGPLNRNGYGSFQLYGANEKAHRAAYKLYYGEIPNGLSVLHKCDNRLCVNPAHLVLGTHQENMQDMKRKGRGSGPKGNRSPHVKLTARQVIAIRADRRSGVAIAKEYGVAYSLIYRIKNGEAWKWL